MFTVTKNKIALQNLSKISAAIITSSNAIEALLEAKLPQNIKIFCVGKITAKKLAAHGFLNIEIAPQENAESLLEVIKNANLDNAAIAYFHGSVISLDFAEKLPNVIKIAAYETHEIENFSAEFLQFSQKNSCDYVLIFSSNSIEIFLKNVTKHNLLAYFKSSNLLCLSEKMRLKANEFFNKSFAKIATFEDLPILREIYDRSQ